MGTGLLDRGREEALSWGAAAARGCLIEGTEEGLLGELLGELLLLGAA